MKPPRFLIVMRYHHLCQTGGAEMQCSLLGSELARRGWDVHYASEWDTLPEPRVVNGVTLHALPPRTTYWGNNRRAVAEVLRELQPDVVYSRVFDPYVGWVALALPEGAVHVWSTASRFDTAPWPTFAMSLRGFSWPVFLRRLPAFLYWDWVARRGRRRAHIVLAQRTDQQAEFAKMGIRAELLRNSHGPVPATDVQTHAGEPLILWADSIKPLKRPEAFLELVRRCRDLPAKFLMLGALTEQPYPELVEAAARELPNFRYGGFVPLAEINQHFRAAHLHVKTSLPIEGFPNTFVQSWMHGVPVASLQADLEGRLARGELGRLAHSMDELEAVVRELIGNPALRREIGARVREFAVREFDLRVNVDKLERLLAERGVGRDRKN